MLMGRHTAIQRLKWFAPTHTENNAAPMGSVELPEMTLELAVLSAVPVGPAASACYGPEICVGPA